ncbi:uncharacterized protein BDW47DRAFT_81941 [Aspergillus candidus]|uniref:Uncharacterized protein n=1 Tax=Aspergillus candidus TaxID=41067 RepID=A0A2I2FJD0_ASPCN|nr:hypothetical protein BDW47DRAFT_81941 [Aspergillus candidus]PLB40737.1 hypothetical protein BDW47DRAFT_81941 [Aspergillus candidus]
MSYQTPCPVFLLCNHAAASQPACHCLDLIDDQSSLIIHSIVKHVNKPTPVCKYYTSLDSSGFLFFFLAFFFSFFCVRRR